jgi:uncharacterized protein (DUF2141 family)
MFLAAVLLVGQVEPVPIENDPVAIEIVEPEAGTVILDIIGFDSDEGRAMVVLQTNDEWSVPPSLDHAGIRVEAPIVDLAVHLEIADVPYGRYVATAFHDEDGDGALDMAEESLGHSGDIPAPGSGPPTFDALYFDLDGSDVVVRITVRKMERPGGMQGSGGPGGGGPGEGGPGNGGPGGDF